ncbi:MAG TPA: hypothetical protein VLA41_00855 [Burkholderiales bacterium]|nr:hypothetical protein [Burkholderiales bacterium]
MAKTVPVTDVGALKNALRKYTHGKKLEIAQFNQVARLAWIGKIVLSPLDPEDPERRAWLLHLERPEGIAAELLPVDEALYGRIHVLDAEQGQYLAEILREGFDARAGELQALAQRDFYLTKFFASQGKT